MDQPSLPDELKSLVTLLDGIIAIPSTERGETLVRRKIEHLERALEAWRYYANQPDNELPLERFSQCRLRVENGLISFQPSGFNRDQGSGTAPIHLQPPLLIFLLLYHRDQYAVFDIIAKFVEKIRGNLTMLDFKRTRTGVTRCFTNTRFAAATLRDYGLLKYTRQEAFKTWVLSLPGILVASKTLKDGKPWNVTAAENKKLSRLHDYILRANLDLQNYDQFVDQLSAVCSPNVEVFETFRTVLTKAFQLLPGYWRALRDPDLTQKERKAATTARLGQLESLPQMEEFYAEFSKCVNVEQLLSEFERSALSQKPSEKE